MKRVLIITYYWPPSGGPGVQRWLKFAKYLRNFQIEPIIVTVHPDKASYPIIDKTLANQLPADLRVEYTHSFEPLKLFSAIFKKEKVPYAGIPDKKSMSLIGKIALYIRANFFIPDARVGWNRFAFKKCEEIIKKEQIDFIITTSPPHSTQLIGLRLKKKYRLKWLVDLRDPWTDIYYYKSLHHTEKSREKDLNYEKEVLENADFITVTSETTKNVFASKLKQTNNKFNVITNGFDEDDLPPLKEVKRNSDFTITFSGTITKQFGIEGFVKALHELTQTGINLHLFFVGNTDPQLKNEIESLLPHTTFKNYVSHREAIQIIYQADMLLLVIPEGNNKGTVPGKTFEYLSTQNPILCLSARESDAGKIIENCGAGKAIEHTDTASIKQFITEKYLKWQNNESLKTDNNQYKKYSRIEITRQLAALIHS